MNRADKLLKDVLDFFDKSAWLGSWAADIEADIELYFEDKNNVSCHDDED